MFGVTSLSIQGRWPLRRAFVFDEHRLALPCWGAAVPQGKSAVLVTLDRHFDLVPPKAPPKPGATVRELEQWALSDADPRNVDHLLAAMEIGLVSDAILIARSRPRGAVEGDRFVDSRGGVHRLITAPIVERVPAEAMAVLAQAEHVILDVDLDCFTTTSDADSTALVPWPAELIRDFLMPPESGVFWEAALSKAVGFTLAREPYHCGGLIATGRLFEVAAKILFVELLGADLP